LTDSVGNIGDGQFGTANSVIIDSGSGSYSPNWISVEGIEFTGPDQHIVIPTFSINPSFPQMSQYSLTLEFWIKDITASGYLFRYASSNLVKDIIAVNVTDTGIIRTLIQDKTPLSTPSLGSIISWKLITISFSITSDFGASVYIYSGSILLASTRYFISMSLSFVNTDIVHIGGPGAFGGKISNFRIYSPGSLG